MKKVTCTLAMACAAFVLDCHDSTVVDPQNGAFTHSVSKATLQSKSDNPIVLDATVRTAAGESYQVKGIVKYTLAQLPILHEDLFTLGLDVNAIVGEMNGSGRSYHIVTTSGDRIDLTHRGSAVVEKWYFLRGGPGSLYLHLELAVTATNVSLVAVTIK